MRLLAAKTALVAAVAFIAGQVLMFASFLTGQWLLSAQDVPNAGLGDPGVLSAIVGGGVYLTAIALLAVGARDAHAGHRRGLATLVAVVFLVPASRRCCPRGSKISSLLAEPRRTAGHRHGPRPRLSRTRG